jgi:hypothetical protein
MQDRPCDSRAGSPAHGRRAEHLLLVFTIESTQGRRHLVENGSEGEDIGAPVDGFASNLLKGHVLRRSNEPAVLRQRPGRVRRRW